ncbi:MAG TPA: S8 family serine peptidase [Candidatus Baltobacteraceae bacterium]|nr:S8 family serine peptidase [Candidatus Baltobacteraceae bacterium]
MNRLSPLFAVGTLALAACTTSPTPRLTSGDVFALVPAQRAASLDLQPLCATPPLGSFRCFGWAYAAHAGIEGYTPRDLQSAYRLPSASRGTGQIVAVVAAYDDPHAESDLNVYRARFHLGSCTSANGCFQKTNEYGAHGHYPQADRGWAAEMSLDLDAVSAVCPKCKLLLVEATTNSGRDLGFAVKAAAHEGASVISNSYGGYEYAAYDPNFDQRGKAIVVAGTGDSGYFPEQPAAFATVVAVGGTTLERANNARGWTERVWNDADVGATGSGCSDFVAKPSWQTDKGCPTRAAADVAAVGDPLTGIAVYDSFPLGTNRPGGWLVIGGTSAATPVIAAIYGLAGNGKMLSSTFAKSIYDAAGSRTLHHINKGNNGSCPQVYEYICNAGKGYNGPTGWGTPNGIGAF